MAVFQSSLTGKRYRVGRGEGNLGFFSTILILLVYGVLLAALGAFLYQFAGFELVPLFIGYLVLFAPIAALVLYVQARDSTNKSRARRYAELAAELESNDLNRVEAAKQQIIRSFPDSELGFDMRIINNLKRARNEEEFAEAREDVLENFPGSRIAAIVSSSTKQFEVSSQITKELETQMLFDRVDNLLVSKEKILESLENEKYKERGFSRVDAIRKMRLLLGEEIKKLKAEAERLGDDALDEVEDNLEEMTTFNKQLKYEETGLRKAQAVEAFGIEPKI